jgi:hypothetical protein
MHTSEHLSPAEAARKASGAGFSLGRSIKPIAARISAWAVARAERLGAEVVYRELSKLSDSDLRRRGLSRATLARDVGAAVENRKAAE